MSGSSFIQELINRQAEEPVAFFGEFDTGAILSSVCAFLNSEGGWILIGYNDKRVLGIENVDQKIDELKALISEHIFPQPLVDVRCDVFKDKNLILLNVLKGSRQPYSYSHKYFVRIDNETQEATADGISLLLRSANDHLSTWEKQTATDAELEYLVLDQISFTITEAKKIGKGNNLPQNHDGFLSYFQLMDMYLIKNGAVILFAKEPIRFLPQVRIRITVMPYGKTGSRFADSVIIEDNLFLSYDRLQNYFRQQLPLISEFKDNDWNRHSREKYPLEALDEAVLNAMIHRDYADLSGEITINIYSDKIEIINSGEMPDDLIVMKSQINDHHSILRNPTIAHIFYLRGKMEKLGRGLALIRDRFVEIGARLPEWSSQNGYTTLTLFSEPLRISLNERAFQFLQKMKTGTEFTREYYQQSFEGIISERTARLDINKMKDGKWIRQIGEGQTIKYIRTNKELPATAG